MSGAVPGVEAGVLAGTETAPLLGGFMNRTVEILIYTASVATLLFIFGIGAVGASFLLVLNGY